MNKMEQLLAFCDWEKKNNPRYAGKTHIAEWAAAEIERLEAERCCRSAVLQERERLLTLAKKRADYEASAAAHHAGKWHAAHEHHLKRHAAMRDLIDALEGPN